MFLFVNNLMPKSSIDETTHGGSADILAPILDAEEENSIAEKLGTDKDAEAKDKLIQHNLRIVMQIAMKYGDIDVDVEDLIAVGTKGLIKSVNTYRKDKDVDFRLYISSGIENEIIQYLNSDDVKTRMKSSDELPKLKYEDYKAILSDIHNMENSEKELKKLERAISKLSNTERQIIELRYGIGEQSGVEMTQKEVADYLGISQSYIYRIEKKIMSELRRENW